MNSATLRYSDTPFVSPKDKIGVRLKFFTETFFKHLVMVLNIFVTTIFRGVSPVRQTVLVVLSAVCVCSSRVLGLRKAQ